MFYPSIYVLQKFFLWVLQTHGRVVMQAVLFSVCVVGFLPSVMAGSPARHWPVPDKCDRVDQQLERWRTKDELNPASEAQLRHTIVSTLLDNDDRVDQVLTLQDSTVEEPRLTKLIKRKLLCLSSPGSQTLVLADRYDIPMALDGTALQRLVVSFNAVSRPIQAAEAIGLGNAMLASVSNLTVSDRRWIVREILVSGSRSSLSVLELEIGLKEALHRAVERKLVSSAERRHLIDRFLTAPILVDENLKSCAAIARTRELGALSRDHAFWLAAGDQEPGSDYLKTVDILGNAIAWQLFNCDAVGGAR